MDITLTDFLREDFDHYRCHFSDDTIQNMVPQQKCVIYVHPEDQIAGRAPFSVN